MSPLGKVRKFAPLLFLMALPCLACSDAPAQGPPSLAAAASNARLEEVLDRLEANLSEYQHTVPDLFCSEHVVSSREDRRTRTATVTDSTFRLHKLKSEDGTLEFEESRVVRAVDGKVPISDVQPLSGPAVLSGVFSDGLRVVSREVRGCYVYTLRPERAGHPRDKLIVDFENLPREKRSAECPPFEITKGSATIDPVTMHVLQLEKTTPDPSRSLGRTATWKWTVNYAPIQVAGHAFWLPQRIQSTTRTDDGVFTWDFIGTYRGYHLFHADSRIVPATP
jgi:hypothetical protein